MEILVIGAKGMLGTDVCAECEGRGWAVTRADIEELDLTDPVAVAGVAEGRFGKPAWCFNCAAYTEVDKAEAEKDQAMMLNGIAPGYLAQACQMADIRLLHVSTDFVFDGEASEPYTEDATPHPLGSYGESKLQGERAVLAGCSDAIIARTSWLYGPNGGSFPRTMIRAWRAGKPLRVVGDQFGTPTYTADLSRVLADIAVCDPEGGIYHTAGPDVVSWHEVAREAVETYSGVVLGKAANVEIEAIRTADWPTPAKRPKHSALSFAKTAALGVEPMRPLREAMAEFCKRLPAGV